MRKYLAETVSFLFGAPWIFIIGWMVLFHSGLDKGAIKFMSIPLLILYIVMPGAYLAYALKRGYIEDLDITKRQERYALLTIYLVAHILILLIGIAHGTHAMIEKEVIIAATYFTIYLITFFWKISIHMALNTVGITFINMTFGWNFIWLYALLPLIALSRLELKKHTPHQLIAGAIIPFVEIAIIRFFQI